LTPAALQKIVLVIHIAPVRIEPALAVVMGIDAMNDRN
jgi:hypothetical protein